MGAIAGEGAVGDGQGAEVVDAAAATTAIARDSAVGDGAGAGAAVNDTPAAGAKAGGDAGELPERVLLATVRVPKLWMPPPPRLS